MTDVLTSDAPRAQGLRAYYDAKIEQLEVALRDKTMNLRRLEAQRNALNGRGASWARDDAYIVRATSFVGRARAMGEREGEFLGDRAERRLTRAIDAFPRARSEVVARGVTHASGTGIVRWRGRQGDGEEEGVGQGTFI